MKYISILRGINVSGQKKIIMKDLVLLYLNLGFSHVVTYIQSGNVIFETPEKDQSKLMTLICESIKTKYNFDIPIIIRKQRELQKIMHNLPFSEIAKDEMETKVLVTFLSGKPSQANTDALLKFAKPPEQMIIRGKEVYLYCPNGYGKTKLSNNFIEKKLNVDGTTRNWKSITKLNELLLE